MGLDVVELIIRVEEEFGIAIEDEEASYLETVGQLHLCILSKTGLLDVKRCQSSATFYQLRRALTDLAVAPRQSIRPNTPIATLVPAANCRRIWKSWSEKSGVKLPELEKPKWMKAACWMLFASTACAGFFLWNTSNLLVFSYYALSFALLCAAYQWSKLYAFQLPAQCATVGGVTQSVMKLNYGINIDISQSHNQEQVWQKLKEIMADELSIEPEKIAPDAYFVRDLRLD